MDRFVDPPPYGDDGGLSLVRIALLIFAAGALLETFFGWTADLWGRIAAYVIHLWNLIT